LNIEYALSDIEQALVISLRRSSWMALDEVWETLLAENPKISRSSIYRILVKEKINVIPVEKKEIAKKSPKINLVSMLLPVSRLKSEILS